MNESGVVFDIQHYSLHDGPGIRTLVFFKGCQLTCPWCSNPESQNPGPEPGYDADRCARCGRCADVCVMKAIDSGREYIIDRLKCDGCGECVKVCPKEALVLFGKAMTVEELMAEVRRDWKFYRRSGGGVTVSGGEPTLQPGFLIAFLERCRREGFHTALETHGFVERETLREISHHVDLFLFDVKHVDSALHQQATGVNNGPILENLRMLLEEGQSDVAVRIPVVPGFNDDEDHMRAAASLLRRLGKTGSPPPVQLLPYHFLGRTKYRILGRRYALPDASPPAPAHMNRLTELLVHERVTRMTCS
jgi:pyruvate formate lyase activating enzyme